MKNKTFATFYGAKIDRDDAPVEYSNDTVICIVRNGEVELILESETYCPQMGEAFNLMYVPEINF